jgi:hypothetical protein
VGTAADGIPAGFPNSTNTGYKRAPDFPGKLTDCSGVKIESNQTYRFCDFPSFTAIGSRDQDASNVKFYGCRFHGEGESEVLAMLYGDNITFDYTSFEPGVSAPPVSHAQGYEIAISGDGSYYTHVAQLTVTHCDLWGAAGAIDINGSTQAKPQVFRDNWIHDPRGDGGIDHTDGLGTTSGSGNGSYLTIDHNSILGVGNTNGLAFQTACTYSHFTVTNNYFSGFGYTVNLGGDGSCTSNMTFKGNTFGTNLEPNWGPLYGWLDGKSNVWQCNYWHVVPGSYYSPSSDDGKYWTPDGVKSTDFGGNTSCPAKPW